MNNTIKDNYNNTINENSLKNNDNRFSVKLSLTKPFHILGNNKIRPQSNYIETIHNKKNRTIENSIKRKENLMENINSHSKTYSNMKLPFVQDENNNDNNDNLNYYKDFNINDGIIYRITNGYKYFIHIPTFNFYMIKKLKYSYYQNLIDKINEWNINSNNNDTYLKFYKTIINNNKDYFLLLIEQPLGYTITEIINSIGSIDNTNLRNITEKIILNIKEEINENINNEFCGCDIFLDINNKFKFIHPLIRNIHSSHKLCNCKITLLKLSKIFNIKINSFFCLGMIILKMISGNMKLPCFKFLFLNYEKIRNEFQCCLFHTLLYIEKNYLDKKEFLLKDLLNFYPKEINNFLCSCLSFNNNDNNRNIYNNNWVDENINFHQRVQISLIEILNIVQSNLNENTYKSFNEFLNNFEIIYKTIDCKLLRNYKEKLINKKIEIILFSKYYDIEKEFAISSFINILNIVHKE